MMTKMIIALIINLIIVLLEVNASINQMRHDPERYFIYYTHLSNIFAGITSLLYVIFGIVAITGASAIEASAIEVSAIEASATGTAAISAQIPELLTVLRLMSTTTVAVTFIVVLTILAPTSGKHGYRKMLLEHNAKYVHLICPMLSIISFLFLEAGASLDFYWTIINLIPTFIYGTVAIICNYKRVWDGPYLFLKVHDQTPLMSVIWGFAIVGGAYLVGLLLWYLNSIIVH